MIRAMINSMTVIPLSFMTIPQKGKWMTGLAEDSRLPIVRSP